MLHRRTTVCREGWYYLAVVALVLGGAVVKEVNLLLILGGMLLGPVLLNWRAVRVMLHGLKIERRLPLRVGAGDVFSVGLTLTNSRRRLSGWTVVAEERIELKTNGFPNGNHHSEPLCPSVLFSHVRAGCSCRGDYRGRLTQRGLYRFSPTRLSTQFPFGLFSRTIAAGREETLIVLPRLGRLTDGWMARRQDALVGQDRRRRQPGPEGDFYGVREWRPGDGRRLIHWRSSARLGRPVVRQFERPRSRDMAVVLDPWTPESPTAAHLEIVELAVSFAATVLSDLCRQSGSNVYLAMASAMRKSENHGKKMEVGGPECVGGPATPAVLQSAMERLATAEASCRDAIPQVLACALRQVDPSAEIVLVSTRAIDLADASRFAALWADPSLRERLRRVRCIDASGEELAAYFQAE